MSDPAHRPLSLFSPLIDGGFDRRTANTTLAEGLADPVSFGMSFLAGHEAAAAS